MIKPPSVVAAPRSTRITGYRVAPKVFRAAGRGRQPQALVEDSLFAGAPDERYRAPGGTRRKAFDRVGVERRLEALRFDPAAPPEFDVRRRKGVRRAAGEQLVNDFLRYRAPVKETNERGRH